MLAIAPVSLVAIPYAIGRFLLTSKPVQIWALLSLVIMASTRNYRPGEGWLSLKVPAKVAPGKGAGGILFELSQKHEELKQFQSKTFHFTKSEAESLAIIVGAVLETEKAVPILVDFLKRYPAARLESQ